MDNPFNDAFWALMKASLEKPSHSEEAFVILKATESTFQRMGKTKIDQMSHFEMADLYKNAPKGHSIFIDPMLAKYFADRFESLGGMTFEMEKRLEQKKFPPVWPHYDYEKKCYVE